MNFIETAYAVADIPDRPIGAEGQDLYVLDSANVLSDSIELTLQTQLSTLASETSTGMVVVTIPTLNDYPIESYALELGREWGVGQEEFDNGIVFLIVPEDRQARIEVGYGLEGVVPDSTAYLILMHTASPLFKDGNYDLGVVQTVAQLEAMVRQEDFDISQIQEDPTPTGEVAFMILFYALPFLWAISSWFSSTKAWWLGGFFGGVFGFIVGMWTGLLIGGIGGLFLDFMVSKYLYQKILMPGGRGGWGGGGGFGGGGSGGIGGFGGGGFGGGGASGRF